MRPIVAAFLLLQLASGGCAAGHSSSAELTLDRHTESLEGWFSAKGEWTLFPAENLGSYDPFSAHGNGRCVTLVNGTGLARDEYAALDGRTVVASGFAARYDDLEGGTGPAERLLSKKYWSGELVENFCLRDLVFVVRDLRERRVKD